MSTNRRTFIGLGATTGAAVALGALPLTAGAGPTCTNPAPGTPPVSWKTPGYQKIINRISAFDPAYNWTRLKKAYAAMKALPNSDPRSMEAQQNMHAWYCASCSGSVPDIHQHWTFFGWHRAFLYFHERILGSLVNDMTLRLPYWDWENASRRVLPPQYYTGSLNDATRDLANGQSVERMVGGWEYDLNLVPGLVPQAFSLFGGTATAGGSIENGAHGFVHVSTGGDMGSLDTAAGDPVFFCHHSNVDRCWYSWEKYDSHADPGAPFPGLTFSFFDETKTWRSITDAQMVPITKLAYAYDTVIAPRIRFPWRDIPLLIDERVRIKPPPPPELKNLANAQEVNVKLTGLQISGSGVFEIRVQSGGKGHHLGTLFVVPHSKNANGEHQVVREANVSLAIPRETARLLTQEGSAISIQRVGSGEIRPKLLQTGKEVPARVRALSLSVR
jgi:tyrosinase-like protein